MNINILDKIKLMQLINEKKLIEKRDSETNSKIFLLIVTISCIAMFLPPKLENVGLIIDVNIMLVFMLFKIVNIYPKIKKKNKEIEEELANVNTQRSVFEYINNFLGMENVSKEALIYIEKIKESLAFKDYSTANKLLGILILENESQLAKDMRKEEELKKKQRIAQYEKELGIDNDSYIEINNKEKEKGWSKIL